MGITMATTNVELVSVTPNLVQPTMHQPYSLHFTMSSLDFLVSHLVHIKKKF